MVIILMHRWQLTGINEPNEVLSRLAISTSASNGDSDQACRRVGTRILRFHEDARTSMEHVAETRILTSSEWQHLRALMSLRSEINVTVTWLFFKAWTYTKIQSWDPDLTISEVRSAWGAWAWDSTSSASKGTGDQKITRRLPVPTALA